MSVRGPRDVRIASVARHQRGRIARRQLLAIGVGAGAITRMLARGTLIRRHRGVYAVGVATDGPWVRETEALLALRLGAVLSHRSALALWDLAEQPIEVHASVGEAPAGRPAGIRTHRTSHLEARDLRIRHDLPVTSPSRSLLDAAPSLTPRALEQAVAEGIRRRLTSPAELRALIGRPEPPATAGARRRIAELLARFDGPAFVRSEAEERFLSLVRDAGLPAPLVNARRHGYEIDFLWPLQRVAVEIDGYAVHSDPFAFERDRRKDRDLKDRGRIEVTRVTWSQLTEETLITLVSIGRLLAVADGEP